MNLCIYLNATMLYSTSEEITRTIALSFTCANIHTKVCPGLATHDVFSERRLGAWRPDIRYTFLSSLSICTFCTVFSIGNCVTSHCEDIV